MTLDECREHIGGNVLYHATQSTAEAGVITSVGDRFAFVRYGYDSGSRATDPAMLTLQPAVAPSRDIQRCDKALDTPSEVCPKCFRIHGEDSR